MSDITFARLELLEASCLNGVELLMLPAMSDHFVGVGTNKLALETVEMGGFVLASTCNVNDKLLKMTMCIDITEDNDALYVRENK